MKRPAFQFYPADWRKDIELRACSVAARGLWVDLICLAHECEPYGHLAVNGRAMTPAQMAGQVGLTAHQCKVLLQELIDNGVARQTADGIVYSKRMVEDELARETRAETGRQNGAKGAEFGSLGAEHGKKGGRPRANNPGDEPPGKPPKNPRPSSSSSSSPSGEKTSLLPQAAARPASEPPALTLVGDSKEPQEPPDCPHIEVLALWAEVLPQLPQHIASQWKGARAEHLRVRWRETAVEKHWTCKADGLAYLRKLFAYIGKSQFLTGRAKPVGDKRPFVLELEWLVLPGNWAKVIEGKYHGEAA